MADSSIPTRQWFRSIMIRTRLAAITELTWRYSGTWRSRRVRCSRSCETGATLDRVGGLRGFAFNQQIAPNGFSYNALFALDTDFNLWLWRSAGLYAGVT